MISDVVFSSAKDDWETPQDFFDSLNAEFGFTLDPAADDRNHKCAQYYTKEQDGLSQDWTGETVFVNPPYGRIETGRWVEKAYNESQKPGTTVVMLIPARTDTKWFHGYIEGKAEIRFVKGRLKFGGSKDDAPFPSMVVVFRDSPTEKAVRRAGRTIKQFCKNRMVTVGDPVCQGCPVADMCDIAPCEWREGEQQ